MDLILKTVDTQNRSEGPLIMYGLATLSLAGSTWRKGWRRGENHR
jgi:hypothetical protein